MIARARGLATAVAAVMFAAMFGLFVYKIVMRYAFGDAVAWADELGVLLFIWVIFWSCAFVVPDREQIIFDLVYKALPVPVQRIVAIARALLIGALFAAAAPAIFGYLQFLNRTQTPVLRWPVGWVYSCFGLMTAAVIVRSVASIVRLCRPDWRTEV
jgi:TRAP-type C4-dicarboxylate transport system permease small subunit